MKCTYCDKGKDHTSKWCYHSDSKWSSKGKKKQESNLRSLPVDNNPAETVRRPFSDNIVKALSGTEWVWSTVMSPLPGGFHGYLCRTTAFERHRTSPACSHMTPRCRIIGLLHPRRCCVFMSRSGFVHRQWLFKSTQNWSRAKLNLFSHQKQQKCNFTRLEFYQAWLSVFVFTRGYFGTGYFTPTLQKHSWLGWLETLNYLLKA